MYIREYPIHLTIDAAGAASGYSSEPCNGLLHSVRCRANDFKGSSAVDSSLKLFRELSSGTTELALFQVAGPSSAWTEFFPRSDVRTTTGAATTHKSTELEALNPINGRLYATFASSAAFDGKSLTLVAGVI